MSEKTSRKFSDVLGALVASVSHARSVADMEALRIAMRYRDVELLKGLPVPRLRFRRVTISLPVILTGLVQDARAVVNQSYVIEDAAIESYQQGFEALVRMLGSALDQPQLTEEEKKRLERYSRLTKYVDDTNDREKLQEAFREGLRRVLNRLALPSRDAPSDVEIREEIGKVAADAFERVFSNLIYNYIEDRVTKQEGKKDEFDPNRARSDMAELNQDEYILGLKRQFVHAAAAAAIRSPTIPPDFEVSVDTDLIKNAGGGPEAVTRISFVLAEEGLEWVTEYDRDGRETAKLMPE
jgi:hypothetical protein